MTEARATAFIRLADGTEQDITGLVQVLYDGVIGSLDWGSGWWDGEDAAAVGWIGLAFGWADARLAEKFAKDIARYQGLKARLDVEIPPIPSPGLPPN
jgi:hypothetical protein